MHWQELGPLYSQLPPKLICLDANIEVFCLAHGVCLFGWSHSQPSLPIDHLTPIGCVSGPVCFHDLSR